MREIHLEHPAITRILRTGYSALSAEPHPCPGCEEDINPGDDVFELEGDLYCRCCFEDWVKDYLSSNPVEVAELLRVEHSYYQGEI